MQGMLGPEKGRAALIAPALRSTQVQTFHGDLLQHMEKNTKLDMQFIKVSLAAALGPPPITGRPPLPYDTGAHKGRHWALTGPRLCPLSRLSPPAPGQRSDPSAGPLQLLTWGSPSSPHPTQGQPPAL